VIIGEHDNFCSVLEFNAFVDSLTEPKQSTVLRGYVDHFNIYRYVQEHLSRWTCSVFGVERITQLASAGAVTITARGPAAAPRSL